MREIEMHVEPTRISDSHTSKGNQLKWEQDGCWYKADAFGYESLAEVVCSNILVHSNLPRPVCYEPVTIIYHGKRYRKISPAALFGILFGKNLTSSSLTL